MSSSIKLSSPTTGEFWEIPVLFEDTNILVLDKPGNILTAPDRSAPERPSLSKFIHRGIREGKPWAVSRGLQYCANGHRLDFEVSGPVAFAKNEATLHQLTNLFGSEQPLLDCVVLVRGVPADDVFEVKSSLSPDSNRPGCMKVVQDGGKKAVTRFEVVERFRGWTLLRCFPLTQRTHQVRVHLREVHFPIAGDRDYNGRALMLSSIKPNYRLKPGRKERPLLGEPIIHLEQLTVPIGDGGEPLRVTSEWPKELRVAVKYLRQFGTA